ncbi:MAG TPA: P-loop NTPase [Bacillota bacterium]|jgi:CO dehydrogenase maturation factor
MKIAISGKGGVGKTTVAAGLIRHLAERGRSVYAVDADPDVSLGSALGIPEEKLRAQAPLVDLKEVIAEKMGDGALLALNPKVDDVLNRYSLDFEGIKFIRMGGIKAAGSACYCRENSFLKAIVDALVLDRDEVVVMDMGAGIEHLTRGTARGVDAMIVVTEPTPISVRTAKVIGGLAQDVGIRRVHYVANKVRGERERRFLAESLAPGELWAIIPFDEGVIDASLDGGGNTPAEGAVADQVAILADRLIDEAGVGS